MALTTLFLHKRPISISATPENAGAVTLFFEEQADVTFFCGTAEFAIDLEAAIKPVLEKHKDTVVPVLPTQDEDEVVF